jgi:hypothetical protein
MIGKQCALLGQQIHLLLGDVNTFLQKWLAYEKEWCDVYAGHAEEL